MSWALRSRYTIARTFEATRRARINSRSSNLSIALTHREKGTIGFDVATAGAESAPVASSITG